MRRSHTLSKRLPLLSMLLSVVATTLACSLAGSVGPAGPVQYLLMSVAGILCMLAQMRWFSPEFRGAFRAEVPLREIGLLCVPFLVQLVASWLLNVADHGPFFHASLVGVAMALSAGFGEEAMFRGLSVPIGMRYLKGDNRVLVTALLTSVVFGLSHLGNAMGGNPIGIFQAIASMGSGLFYCAVFLRSGSVLVGVAMHLVFDWMYFATNPALQAGDVAAMAVTVPVIVSCVVDLSMGAVGLWLIRPDVRGRIEAVWRRKWDGAGDDADTDASADAGTGRRRPRHMRGA